MNEMPSQENRVPENLTHDAIGLKIAKWKNKQITTNPNYDPEIPPTADDIGVDQKDLEKFNDLNRKKLKEMLNKPNTAE